MSELSATGLVLRRGSRLILDGVSFHAASGDFVAVIGPNGAGKSTLLAALAGLIKPERGSIALDGRALADFPVKELARRRAYLPQNPRCEWPIAVERLVALGLTPVLPAFGGLSRDFQKSVDAALTQCDLIDRRSQPATTLSGGELARAMFARALVGDPEILIADEPMTGLDPRHALDTAMRLRDLAGKGKTVIAAIHDLTIAARFATRIFALHAGKVAADGPRDTALTAELLQRIFGVDASVVQTPSGAYVDYVPPRIGSAAPG